MIAARREPSCYLQCSITRIRRLLHVAVSGDDLEHLRRCADLEGAALLIPASALGAPWLRNGAATNGDIENAVCEGF